jgi:ubiquinone/menaquinone biosynthesis C-methylase UbiE
MVDTQHRVCPVEKAGILDSRLRRWLQNPRKIVSPYIQEGMTVLDVGCGPGFFSIDMAQMVGKSGRVIACDLQEGMLQKLRDKIKGTEFEHRITLHVCQKHALGVSESVDFVLAFYVVHELAHREGFFQEIGSLLNPGGQALIVEPSFHVSSRAFEETVSIARGSGFMPADGPKVLLSKSAILRKDQP